MSRFLEFIKRIFKPPAARRVVITAIGLIILLVVIECGLNLWIRSGLRRSLAADPVPSTEIVSKLSWLGLDDILAGKVNRLRINARNCSLNDLRYSRLTMDSQGFRFNLAVLLKEKRLKITRMKKTRINGVIDEPALNDYLNLRYPEYQSSVKIKPGGLILSGTARILNKIIPVVLEGELRTISGKKLRFYPTRLLIAKSSISGSLLRVVSEQVPLEFGVMEDWPLEITGFKLVDNQIIITMEEFKASSR